MNLATRCNACGTVFRIVRDQLRVSDGWVRCGRCQAVFNASDDLFELDEGEPSPSPQTPAPPHQPPAVAGEAAHRMLDELAADRRRWQADAAAMPAAWSTPARPAEGLHDEVTLAAPPATAPPPAQAFDVEPQWQLRPPDDDLDDEDEDDRDGAATEPAEPAVALDLGSRDAPPVDDGRPATIVTWDSAPARAAAASSPPEAGAAPPLPSFVRRADRAAFWRTPRMRLGLAAVAALLAAALALQIGHAARDQIAAQWPALQPPLEDLCRVTGCRVSALRQIDRLSVDSAGLSVVEGAPLYRLQLVLHNRADISLLAPALELSLNDAQGALIARRVLQGAELGLSATVVGAGQELPLLVMLATRERRIAGYNVELFYP